MEPLRESTLLPEFLRHAETLSVRVRAVVDALRVGSHRSPHRGTSIVFREHAEYRPGDDLRHLDWRASARRDRNVLKRFEQESSLTAWLAVDASGSMAFRDEAGAPSKYEYGATVALGAAHVLAAQGDSFGVARAAAAPERALPPRGGPSQFRAALEALAVPPEDGRPGDPTALLSWVLDRADRRTLVVLVSDLIGAGEGLSAPLRRARARGHEVWVLQVLTRTEMTLPMAGGTRFLGAEGEASLDADADAVRASYQREVQRWLDETRNAVIGTGARHVLARTDAAAEDTLRALLEAPRGRAAWAF